MTESLIAYGHGTKQACIEMTREKIKGVCLEKYVTKIEGKIFSMDGFVTPDSPGNLMKTALREAWFHVDRERLPVFSRVDN